MTCYNLFRQHYRQHQQQAKCMVVFCMMLLPLLLTIPFVKTYSVALHFALWLLAGWFTWTFVEYILHRFYMHRKGAGVTHKLAHAHHHHHTHPTEIKVTPVQRLQMAFILIVFTGISFYGPAFFIFFTGLCYGIVGYFTMHKVLHQRWAAKVFRRLFRYHIYHHCKYPNSCYGISVPWWDDVFQTVPKNPQITPRVMAFYLGAHAQ